MTKEKQFSQHPKDAQPTIKDQIREALREGIERFNAQEVERKKREDQEWVIPQVKRIIEMCKNAGPGELLDLLFLVDETPNAEDTRRAAILSEHVGINLNALNIGRASHSGGRYSIQILAKELLRRLES